MLCESLFLCAHYDEVEVGAEGAYGVFAAFAFEFARYGCVSDFACLDAEDLACAEEGEEGA